MRTVARNFVPVFVSRGVVQVSAYVDTLLASWLPTGAVTGLTNAQLLYTLPVSLFGMSVAAAELPAMSGAATARCGGTARPCGDGSTPACGRSRSSSCRRRWRFSRLATSSPPALLQTGRFGRADAVYVWGILAGSAVGLLASTLGRLYSSAYYALRDHAHAAAVMPSSASSSRRCWATSVAIPLPRWLGISERWGAAGLTASAGVAGWVEMLLLRRTLNARIGQTGLPASFISMLWLAAAAGAAAAWAIKLTVLIANPIISAVVILGPYGLVFFAMTLAMRIREATNLVESVARRLRPRRNNPL